MAQRVQIILEDDIDGGVADKTIQFGWDGSGYEIDLSDKHAGEFEQTMRRWLENARRVSAARRSSGKRQPVAAASSTAPRVITRADPAQLKAIRTWARSTGLQISDRGRIAASVVEAFEAAH